MTGYVPTHTYTLDELRALLTDACRRLSTWKHDGGYGTPAYAALYRDVARLEHAISTREAQEYV